MIVLVHHGDAVPAHIDATRPLSTTGRQTAERLAREAASRGVRPDVIWHSGKLRARQTADVFRQACNPLAPCSAVRGLRPGDPAAWMYEQLRGDPRHIMVVGHMPHLPLLLSMLTAQPPGTPTAHFPLNGVVALEAESSGWREIWRLGS
jgi:phosphohistidine phosphatase